MTAVTDFAERVVRNVETVIVGKRPQLQTMMVALLCQGHVLIEDVPGTGKTMLARAIAASMGLGFKRVQCTPDLLPNDITGVNVFNQQTARHVFNWLNRGGGVNRASSAIDLSETDLSRGYDYNALIRATADGANAYDPRYGKADLFSPGAQGFLTVKFLF